MLRAALYRVIVALTILAFFGGMTLQLMPPKLVLAAPARMDDCAHMAMPLADAGSSHTLPCKSMDPECVKQMGCLGTASLPLPHPAPPTLFAYSSIHYWSPARVFTGRSIEPELLPPIAL